MNGRTLPVARFLLEQAGGAYCQVSFRGNTGKRCGKDNIVVSARAEAKLVGAVDEAENGLQQVITIVAPADYVQK